MTWDSANGYSNRFFTPKGVKVQIVQIVDEENNTEYHVTDVSIGNLLLVASNLTDATNYTKEI